MHHSDHPVFSDTPYIRKVSSLSPAQLAAIDEQLQNCLQNNPEHLRKTHYFHGRYENLYVDASSVSSDFPDLQPLIDESLHFCAEMLGVGTEALKIGYWFNLMEPGQITTLHRHDDYDEVISGVVYLVAPDNSGDLVLVTGEGEISLPPIAGNFLSFSPATPHKVSENRSSSRRLSIGMNIGLRD